MGELSAGVLEKEFPVDSECGGEQIHSQGTHEQSHATATVKEESLLHCCQKTEAVHEAKERQK
jgi:hypothetical protein